MNKMKFLTIVLFALSICNKANGEEFTIENFKYSVAWDDVSVYVSKADNATLTGELIIPETVQHEGVTYSVRYIEWRGFVDSDITAVKLPNTITDLNGYCFSGCKKLKTINLPQNITYLGDRIFEGCSSLESIESHIYFPFDISYNTPFDATIYANTELKVPTGSINRYRSSTGWKEFSTITEKEMDDVDKNILTYTILDDNNVSVSANSKQIDGDVVIPSEVIIESKTYTVKKIQDNGFENCTKITSFSLPSNITEIGWWAFAYTNIKNIDLPENLETIGSWAFHGCPKLERITIPKKVDDFGWGVFSGDCNNLMEISVEEGNPTFKVTDGMLLSVDGSIMAAYAFGRTNENLTIPESVTSLNVCALFKGNKRLKTITVPSGVKYIGGDTFADCTALTNVYLPDGITDIGYTAFSNCTSLKDIIIPSALSKISSNVYYGCSQVETVTVRQNTPLEISSDLFNENVYQNATLYIPIGRTKFFKDAIGWGRFANIKEIEMDGIASSESPYDNIEDNQMILGYYSSNECQSAGADGYGGPKGGIYKVCIGFTKDQISPFAGNQIKNVRFGLVQVDDMSEVHLWIGSSRDQKDLYTQNINNLKTGWNEIELTTPYTLTEDDIFVGIEYKTQNRNYPISCVSTGKEKGSSYFYGPYNNGESTWLETWESQSLSLQCLIEGDKLPQNLIRSLPPVVNSLYQKSGETISGNVSLKNWGKRNIESYDIKYQIDGNDVEFDQWSLPTIGRNDYATVYYELKVPQSLEAGQHRLTAVITQVNGMPSQYYLEGSMPTPLKVYTKSYERNKVVIDHLTAQWCPNSERADKEIEEVMTQHDDIILLTSNLQDNLSCEASEAFGIFSEYIPAIYYDRYSTAGSTSLGYAGYETAKKQPSLITVNVSATYSEGDNQIHVKVQGECNDEFAAVEGDANLTVLITEDKIDAPQNDNETGGYDHYEHNGVIRGNVSAIWGDPIQWNGNYYDMDFTMPYNSNWNLDNLHVVAFVARPYNGNLGDIHILNSDQTEVELPEKLVVKAYHGFLGDIAINERFDAKGVTADGASQLIIYSEKEEPEIKNATISLSTEFGNKTVTDIAYTGSISSVKQLDNGRWGFIYTAPEIYPEESSDSKIPLHIRVKKQDGQDIIVDLEILRPAVMFLHGLGDNSSCFAGLADYLIQSGSYNNNLVRNVSYATSNTASFSFNTFERKVVEVNANSIYQNLTSNGIVSTKYDLVGHSMGGILSRLYAQEGNADKVNRIITLDTPHSGSQGANHLKTWIIPTLYVAGAAASIAATKNPLFLSVPIITLIITNKFDTPAVDDLMTTSSAITMLNGTKKQNVKGIPVHAVCSYMLPTETPVDNIYGISQPMPLYCSAIETDYFLISKKDFLPGKSVLDIVFEEEYHDGVVSKTSQEGGLSERHITYETDTYKGIFGLSSDAHHIKTPKWIVSYNNIYNLLRKPKNADCFSTEGFNPVDLSHQNTSKSFRAPVSTPDYSSIPSTTFFKLYLAEEDDGSIIDVKVRNSENIINNLVFTVIDNDNIIISTEQSDYRFLIPDTLKGKIVVYSLGMTDEGIIVGDTAFIHYNSDVELSSIKFKNEGDLTLKISDYMQLDVVGIWSNGEETAIIPTFTTDNSNILSISNDTIFALSEGECLLYASYGGRTVSLKVKVNNSTGIKTNQLETFAVKCTNKKLIISVPQDDIDKTSIEIFTSDGKLCRKIDRVSSEPIIIDLTTLTTTVYIARIKVGDETFDYKFLNR